MPIETLEQHERLVQALMDERRWPQGGGDRRRIDTHISTVLLAGDVAYKIKKPLDLGFLDFLSLASRRHACDEELRLNRRLAPQIYRHVCAITGEIDSPQIDGHGAVIDWAVCMRRFDADAVLSNPRCVIDANLVDQLADTVATFHETAPSSPIESAYGNVDGVLEPMRANFTQLGELPRPEAQRVARLRDWTERVGATLHDRFAARKRDARVRECHGDLHLGNVALIDGRPVVFDAIEFNPGLRWIDTANDVAFLTMDMHQRGMADLAYRFIDRYLFRTGDYGSLAVLRFYEVYRALVRAKIAAIRLRQVDAADGVATELQQYLSLAGQLTQPRRGALLITHGPSGSGKSFVTRELPERLHGVRLRSDVERKRLLGISPGADATAQGAYASTMTEKTYAALAEHAAVAVSAGYVAVVDATFLQQRQRDAFADLATRLQVPFVIIDCSAPIDTLRRRIAARQHQRGNVSDADHAVLERQLRTADPLSTAERRSSVHVAPDQELDVGALRDRITRWPRVDEEP
ncbi:MAG: AAA family ATPase [Gammaproteobacteria bacterium]|nr:AAA family ATPase [Gammaproteobacteria bacterium]